jgi:cytochrome oxidase Cu insertion factor (SCO1/SenC/PrrC family)
VEELSHGKGGPTSSETPPSKPTADYTASEILKQLLATYRQAKTYQDQAVVRLSFRQGDQPVHEEFPAAVAFERPNKLSLVAYQATVKCDGKELRARIDDPQTSNVDNQVVVRPAPQELKLADLASDQLLYDILSSQLRRQPIQLELLLESGGLISAFSADVACRRLADEEHGGVTCFRVEVPSPGGPFVFWVGHDDFLLRRLDYPAAALLPDLVNAPDVKDVQLYADLRGAQVGDRINRETFALEIPAGATRMKTFVVPPRPLPTKLLGKAPGEFFFLDLSGERVTAEQLTGKIAVLTWYHDNPACEATLQQVALARERLGGEEDAVAFYAIATDPTSMSNENLERKLADWKVKLPIVRDLEAFGDKAFKIEFQPTIIVLDAEGRVQIFQPGGNPQLADQIVQIAERLKSGDNLAKEIIESHARQETEYHQLLARGGPEPGEILELPEAVIRQRSQPKTLKLTELWTNSEIRSPGNMLLVEEPGQPTRVLVFEGWRSLVELDAAGRILARHALHLPEQSAVTFARTATDKSGQRYFVAAAPLSPQIFLFDADWKLLRTLPAADQTPLSVMDLALSDLGDADGVPEILAANVADLGLIALSLEGEVVWRNRAFPNVTSVAPSQPDDIGSWAIYLAGDAGTVLRVSRFGKEEPPVAIADWPVLKLTPARFAGANQAPFLAISNNLRGEVFAVGISGKLKEAWNYPLPAGAHQKPIEPVTSSNLLPGRQGEWWLAGPDGSIHVISEDGEFHDSFHYGAALTGLAATNLNGRPVLLIATDTGVSAFQID